MINKEQVTQKFSASVQTYAEESFAQQHIARKMAQLLEEHVPFTTPKQVVELGCGTGYFSRQLIQLYGESPLILNDICPAMLSYCREHLDGGIRLLPGDGQENA